jgi:20S proteasome alpha/beta subunit
MCIHTLFVPHLLYLCLLLSLFHLAGSAQVEFGGTLLAAAGKDCVVMCTDSRFAAPGKGSHIFISQQPRKVFQVGDRTLVGCYGLDGDINLLMKIVRHRLNNVSSSIDGGPIGVGSQEIINNHPEMVAESISNILYETGLYAIPLIVGIAAQSGEPYLCSMDMLGAKSVATSSSPTHASHRMHRLLHPTSTQKGGYLAIGTSAAALLTHCERLYASDLSAPQLVSVCKQCMKLALTRDSQSGCRVRILTMLKNGEIYETFQDIDAV